MDIANADKEANIITKIIPLSAQGDFAETVANIANAYTTVGYTVDLTNISLRIKSSGYPGIPDIGVYLGYIKITK